VRRSLSAVVGAALPPVVWFAAYGAGLVQAPVPTACLSGFAIFGASFLLTWATEAAQVDIPGPLAVAFLALVAVLPEYAVDVYFAWQAGRDPAYTAFATANMTGANRLLIGIGWAVPVFAVWFRYRATEVVLPREQAVEVNFLALATLYSFVIPLKGTLALVDTCVLFLIFVAYMVRAARTRHEEPELEGPAAMIAGLGPAARRVAVLGVFALAGAAIFTAAEPFAESLVAIGEEFGIEKFLLVQWLAPLASESPEFIVATLFALRGAAAAGMGTMISSKVNQWTLLVGALPAAFAISHGGFGPMHLDARQREEIFLTSAQSLFALVVLANFRFSLGEAFLLFALFAPQFLLTSQSARLVLAGIYLALSLGAVVVSADTRRGVLALLPGTQRLWGSRRVPDG
jgi:cation:H+ antiporter